MSIGYLIGMGIGALVTYVFMKLYLLNGTLQIDKHDPEKDIYRLCVDSFNKIERRRYVLLKIDKHADLTRK